MDIAVVIPLYNGEKWIRQTLDAVAAQTLAPHEVVVVDDGSTDASPSIAADYPCVRLIRQAENSGPNAARNRGFQETTAEAVAFLDHDDLWHPEHLRITSQALEKHRGAIAAFSHIVSFDSGEKPRYSITHYRPHLRDPWKRYPTTSLGEPVGALIRRNALTKVGGWSSQFDGCADYHLWLRLALIGKLVGSGCTTAAFRKHGTSYGDRLRAHETLGYYEKLIGASEDALKRRRERNLSTEDFENRLDAQCALRDLFASHTREDRQRTREALIRFEEATLTEPHSIITAIWDNFLWHVGSYYSSNRIYTTLDLLEEWPSEAKRTQRILRKWALQRFPTSVVHLVRRYPRHLLYWRFLVRRITQKLRAMLPQK